METFKKIVFLILTALFTHSCIVSLYPLYLENDLIIDDTIIGEWINTDELNEKWLFEKQDEKSYKLTHIKDSSKAIFTAHLLKLEAYYYLDLFPESLSQENDFYDMHILRLHSFYRIKIHEEQLSLHMLETDWLSKVKDSVDIKIDMNFRGENHVLLLSETEKLQSFVKTYADEPGAYSSPTILKRKHQKK